jgi:hypothetical protein
LEPFPPSKGLGAGRVENTWAFSSLSAGFKQDMAFLSLFYILIFLTSKQVSVGYYKEKTINQHGSATL